MPTHPSAYEDLIAHPWSREIVVDEDGVFIARVPELPGCFIDGDTAEEALENLQAVLEDWLRNAVDKGKQVPPPRRLADDHSGRFSVRVPRSLHRALSHTAAEEGASLNQLVNVLLARAVWGTDAGSTLGRDESDAHEPITADAVQSGSKSISALKGIATFLRNRGDTNLACLVYATAADRIAASEGQQAAARELGVAASLARREGRMQLAEALYRECLHRDPTNLRSSSALGQLLYWQGRFAEAIDYLGRAAEVDPYAKLFLGWSRLRQAIDLDEAAERDLGLSDLTKALRDWAYSEADRRKRASWLRQVRRLAALGSPYQREASELIDFANANAGWGQLSVDDLRINSEDDLQDDVSETLAELETTSSDDQVVNGDTEANHEEPR